MKLSLMKQIIQAWFNENTDWIIVKNRKSFIWIGSDDVKHSKNVNKNQKR